MESSFLRTPSKNTASEFPDVIFSLKKLLFRADHDIFTSVWLVSPTKLTVGLPSTSNRPALFKICRKVSIQLDLFWSDFESNNYTSQAKGETVSKLVKKSDWVSLSWTLSQIRKILNSTGTEADVSQQRTIPGLLYNVLCYFALIYLVALKMH